MNNRVLKIVAGVLALGAVGVAVLGIQLSRQKPAVVNVASLPASAATASAVVATRLLKPGQAINADDVSVRPVAVMPEHGYRSVADVVGRIPSSEIASGDALSSSYFASVRLASLLREGERAVAVRVDEVVAVGGFAQPGDRVDVLVFLQATPETASRSLAQVVIHDARLLSIGEASELLQEETTKEAVEAKAGLGSSAKAKTGNEAREQRANQRSAVLALPEAQATRLMLAASAGQLRLALRPPTAMSTSASATNVPAAPLALADLAKTGSAKQPSPPLAATPAPATVRGIIIHEGDKVRTSGLAEGRQP